MNTWQELNLIPWTSLPTSSIFCQDIPRPRDKILWFELAMHGFTQDMAFSQKVMHSWDWRLLDERAQNSGSKISNWGDQPANGFDLDDNFFSSFFPHKYRKVFLSSTSFMWSSSSGFYSTISCVRWLLERRALITFSLHARQRWNGSAGNDGVYYGHYSAYHDQSRYSNECISNFWNGFGNIGVKMSLWENNCSEDHRKLTVELLKRNLGSNDNLKSFCWIPFTFAFRENSFYVLVTTISGTRKVRQALFPHIFSLQLKFLWLLLFVSFYCHSLSIMRKIIFERSFSPK